MKPVVRKESDVESRITAYCDSHWPGNVSDRKSHGSYLLLLNDAAVTRKSCKQKCTAGSLTEAEYTALELRFLSIIMYELCVGTDKEVVCDHNQECMRWTEVRGKRTKHIDVRYQA